MSFDQLMRICRGCLASERKMFSATNYETDFKDVTGIAMLPSDGFPQWLCYECIALLQKCVRFRNKVKDSHVTVCQYMLESVPFPSRENVSSYLCRASVLHYDVPSTHTEHVEEPLQKVGHISKSVIADVESVIVKEENIAEQVCCEEDLNNLQMDIARKASICDFDNVDSKNISLVTLKHEEPIAQEEIKAQINPVVDDVNLNRVEVKDETSCSCDDNITVEEWCLGNQNELRKISLTHKPNHEEQMGKEETASGLECTGISGERHSAQAPASLNELTNIASRPLKEDDAEVVKRENTNSNISVNDSNSFSSLELYQCDECSKTFNNKILLIAHICEHSQPTQPYKCDVCMKCFTHRSSYTRHKNKHTGIKPYQCDVCRKDFTNKGSYNVHIRIHTGEKSYKCNVCMKSFIHRRSYERHKAVHTGIRPYQCNVCRKDFTNRNNYNIHVRIHTGEKPYKCNVCMKCFAHKQSYNKHLLIHTGEKPYECEVCMKPFRTRGDLKRHNRLHTGDKPYKCDVCTKTFRSHTGLQLHYRIHTGEKPYKCEICMKCFSNTSSYKVHKRIHTGERPYKCDVCMKDFTCSGDLKKHIRIHTNDKPSK